MKTVTLYLFIALMPVCTFAQSIKKIKHDDLKIPETEFVSLAVDNDGNKWFGTAKFGLFEYTGKDFIALNKTNSPVASGYISPVYKDSKGNIWVSYTDKIPMLGKFDGVKWTVFSKKNYPGLEDDITAIAEDKTGKIYFGTFKGLFTFFNGKWSKINLPKEEIYSYVIRSIDVNTNGCIAIGHNSGLLVFNGKSWESYTDTKLQLSTVLAVKYSPADELYVGYGGGLGNGGFSVLKNNMWQHYNKHNSKLPDHTVRKIDFDKKGNIWMATNNGLLKIRGKEWSVLHFGNQHVYGDAMLAFDFDKDGSVWIANAYELVHYTEND